MSFLLRFTAFAFCFTFTSSIAQASAWELSSGFDKSDNGNEYKYAVAIINNSAGSKLSFECQLGEDTKNIIIALTTTRLNSLSISNLSPELDVKFSSNIGFKIKTNIENVGSNVAYVLRASDGDMYSKAIKYITHNSGDLTFTANGRSYIFQDSGREAAFTAVLKSCGISKSPASTSTRSAIETEAEGAWKIKVGENPTSGLSFTEISAEKTDSEDNISVMCIGGKIRIGYLSTNTTRGVTEGVEESLNINIGNSRFSFPSKFTHATNFVSFYAFVEGSASGIARLRNMYSASGPMIVSAAGGVFKIEESNWKAAFGKVLAACKVDPDR